MRLDYIQLIERPEELPVLESSWGRVKTLYR